MEPVIEVSAPVLAAGFQTDGLRARARLEPSSAGGTLPATLPDTERFRRHRRVGAVGLSLAGVGAAVAPVGAFFSWRCYGATNSDLCAFAVGGVGPVAVATGLTMVTVSGILAGDDLRRMGRGSSTPGWVGVGFYAAALVMVPVVSSRYEFEYFDTSQNETVATRNSHENLAAVVPIIAVAGVGFTFAQHLFVGRDGRAVVLVPTLSGASVAVRW